MKKRCCILKMLKEMLDLDMQIKKMLDIHEWQNLEFWLSGTPSSIR